MERPSLNARFSTRVRCYRFAWHGSLSGLAVVSAACDAGPAKHGATMLTDPDAAPDSLDGGVLPHTPDAAASEALSLDDPIDIAISGLSDADLELFSRGDDLFSLSLGEPDGLGPLYTRDNCDGCHRNAVRGPGLVQKMSVVQADGKTPAADQSLLAFGHAVRPLLAAGATLPILAPANSHVRVSIRLGAPVLGRGYLEAVLDSEIERVAEEQSMRDDAIQGRINHVVYASEANPDMSVHTHQKGDIVIGRFGLKARIATLDDFCADAMQSDMGITSPLRPTELPNPDGLMDDLKVGIDVTLDSVNGRASYTRRIAIPRRAPGTPAARVLFDQVKCSVCHAPTLHTRADYPIAQLSDIDAPIYSDLLLHDMGDGLADSLGESEGEAGPRDWRTSPLIGLRFLKGYLHDGRVQTIELAIEAHASEGSEASESAMLFQALSYGDRQALLDFVHTL